MRVKLLIAAFALCAAAVAPGCGAPSFPTARLEGAVTVDGQPVEQGNINFTPVQAGRLGTTAPITHGRYVAQGVPQGKVRVDFHATKETGRTVMQFGKPYPETVDLIPAKYASGVEIEVAGDDKKDFHLTSK